MRKCSICNKEGNLYYNEDYKEPICEECVNKILVEINKKEKHRQYIEDIFFPLTSASEKEKDLK